MTSFLVTAGAAKLVGAATPLVATTVGRGTVTGLVAVVGLVIGSFLNVVVYRVPRGLSVVEPRSFCPHCHTPLRSVDNIPLLSWVVLRGRCRRCRGPISVRYPLVELATGVVFAAVGWGLGPHWAVAGFCVVAATLVALVTVERDGLAPPLSVAVTGSALAVALLVAAGLADRRWPHVIGVVVGSVVASVLVAASGRRRAQTVGTSPWMAAAPALLPVGAALGWLGPVAVGVGLATALVVLVAVRVAHHRRPSSAPGAVRGVLTLALAVGVAAATAAATAVSTGVGT